LNIKLQLGACTSMGKDETSRDC